MKSYLILIFVLSPILSIGQSATPISQNSKYYEFKNAVRVDSAFFIPRKDTSTTDATLLAPGMLVYRPTDSLLYYRKGSAMTRISNSGDLSTYMKYSDSAAMLVPYLRKADTTGKWAPIDRTLNFIAGVDVNITGGSQDLSDNRTWTVNNTSTLNSVSTRGASTTNTLTVGGISTQSGTNPTGIAHYTLNNGMVSRRWVFGLFGNETGSNNGSYLFFSRYDDAGVFMSTPLYAERKTGIFIFDTIPQKDSIPLALVDGSNFQSLPWGVIAGKPTTISGYGITDADLDATLARGASSTRNITLNGSNGGIVLLQDGSGNNALYMGLDKGAFGGASNDGLMYVYGTNRFGIATNNIRRVIVDDNGDMSVGHTAPGARLDVKGASASTGSAFKVQNSAGTSVFEVGNNGEMTFMGIKMATGIGSPEGVITAPVGSFYLRKDGGAGTVFYVKESGTGNTGWAAK